jgi:hypothetical protein
MLDPSELYERLKEGDHILFRDPVGEWRGLVQGRTPKGLLLVLRQAGDGGWASRAIPITPAQLVRRALSRTA